MTSDAPQSRPAPASRHRYKLPIVRELPRRWDAVSGRMVVDARPPRRRPAA